MSGFAKFKGRQQRSSTKLFGIVSGYLDAQGNKATDKASAKFIEMTLDKTGEVVRATIADNGNARQPNVGDMAFSKDEKKNIPVGAFIVVEGANKQADGSYAGSWMTLMTKDPSVDQVVNMQVSVTKVYRREGNKHVPVTYEKGGDQVVVAEYVDVEMAKSPKTLDEFKAAITEALGNQRIKDTGGSQRVIVRQVGGEEDVTLYRYRGVDENKQPKTVEARVEELMAEFGEAFEEATKAGCTIEVIPGGRLFPGKDSLANERKLIGPANFKLGQRQDGSEYFGYIDCYATVGPRDDGGVMLKRLQSVAFPRPVGGTYFNSPAAPEMAAKYQPKDADAKQENGAPQANGEAAPAASAEAEPSAEDQAAVDGLDDDLDAIAAQLAEEESSALTA